MGQYQKILSAFPVPKEEDKKIIVVSEGFSIHRYACRSPLEPYFKFPFLGIAMQCVARKSSINR